MPTCVKNILERRRQTDIRTKYCVWYNRPLRSFARQKLSRSVFHYYKMTNK